MERLAYDNGIEPQTQTSASLRGGAPPIPPHNRPPVATAVGMPDPEPNSEGTRGVVECTSEEEAHATIRQMGYFVTKIATKPFPEHSVHNKEQETPWQSAFATIQALYWSTRDQLIETVEAFNEGYRMAHAPKKHPKVLS